MVYKFPGEPKKKPGRPRGSKSKKYGQPENHVGGAQPIEKSDPETGAAMVDFALMPLNDVESLKRLKEAAEACGFPPDAFEGLVRRLRTRYLPMKRELQAARTSQFLAHIDDRIMRVLGYMDDFAMSQASVRDLAIALGVLVDKRQILRAEPGQQMTKEERANLNTLIPEMLRQAKARGLMLEMQPDGRGGFAPAVLKAAPEEGA